MIHIVSGENIFNSKAQTIVNPVNCVGVMGAGLAKQFKERYQHMFETYRKFCAEGLLKPGILSLHKESDHWILNFPTKKHWRDPSKMEYIEAGLQKFVQTYEARGITSIAFPPIGCGLGGLDWETVKAMMYKYLGELPIDVYLYSK